MKRLLFIAQFEFLRQITRRQFLVLLFGMPLLFLLIVGGFGLVIAIFVLSDSSETMIGYVDQAGFIREETFSTSTDTVPLHPYPDKDAAHAAYLNGTIDAYVIFPPDYLDEGDATVYAQKRLSFEAQRTLRRLVRQSLIADNSDTNADLAAFPLAELDHRLIPTSPPTGPVADTDATPIPSAAMTDTETLDSSNAAASDNMRQERWFFPLIFIFGIMFWSTFTSSSSYLLQALVDEKENRTMEIVVTSVSPEQLIGGKTLGLGIIGMTQLLVWLSYIMTPLTLLAPFFQSISDILITLTGTMIPLAIVFFIPFYFLYAGLIVTIGAIVSSVQEGQQLSSLVMLPSIIPMFLLPAIQQAPNGVLAVALSMFPFTSPLTLIIRLSLTPVPFWQIVLSLLLLLLGVLLVIKGSAHIFRLGMLRYGKAIKLRELVRMVRASRRRPPAQG
jgi:ABC-2 type transport system permease protein